MKKLSLKRIIIFSRLQVTGIYGKNIWKILGLATSLPVILVLVSFLVQQVRIQETLHDLPKQLSSYADSYCSR